VAVYACYYASVKHNLPESPKLLPETAGKRSVRKREAGRGGQPSELMHPPRSTPCRPVIRPLASKMARFCLTFPRRRGLMFHHLLRFGEKPSVSRTVGAWPAGRDLCARWLFRSASNRGGRDGDRAPSPSFSPPCGVLRSLAVLNNRLSALLAFILVLLLPALMAPDDSGAGWLAGGGIAAIVCIALSALLSFAIYIYLIYFVYTDASARGQNAILWAVLTAIPSFTLIVFIVWLIIRPEKKV